MVLGRVDPISRKGSLAASWHEVGPSPEQEALGEAPGQGPASLRLEAGSPWSLDTRRTELGVRHGLTLLPLRVTAGTRARYVDILNPGGPQRSEPALAPTDLFAPLAPLPIPAHLLGPNTGTQPGQQGCPLPACWPRVSFWGPGLGPLLRRAPWTQSARPTMVSAGACVRGAGGARPPEFSPPGTRAMWTARASSVSPQMQRGCRPPRGPAGRGWPGQSPPRIPR